MNQFWENGKKLNFGPDFGLFGLSLGPPIFFSWVLPQLDVRHFCKLWSYGISRKTYDPNWRKWQISTFWVWFGLVGPKFGPPNFIFKNLPLSVTKYHGQLSSPTISENTNDQILRKFSNKLTADGQADRWIGIIS